MRLIADAIEKTPPHPQKSWNHRIVLGCWAVSEALELIRVVIIDNLKGQIHPLVRFTPTHLSNNAHRLLAQLRPTIFLDT